MNEYQATALSRLIIDHIRLARSRRETLVWLIGSMLKAGTVNLNRLAPHIESAAQTASVHRRLERFFNEVKLNETEVARLVVGALGIAGKPWHLAMDRTNWQFGKTDLNILVLSVALDDVCVPLFWRVLDKAGNSNAVERIDLMQTCLSAFADQPVASFTGDREFIGNAWIAWLQDKEIPHFLRLREDMKIFDATHAPLAIAQHAARLKVGERLVFKGEWRIGSCEKEASPPVRIVVLRLKTGELLTLASRARPKHALAIYRKRWKIESLFAALKTRGFNLEATHMAAAEKISTLMALLAMAASLACTVGLWTLGKRRIGKKAHGRPARSLFAFGLDALRKLFAPRTFAQSLLVLLAFLLENPRKNRAFLCA
jgi:DDE family transposase